MAVSGGCLCGQVRYHLEEIPSRAVNCHCSMCRKHSGAAFLTYFVVPNGSLQMEGTAPVEFQSSAEAVRTHCGACGSPLTFIFNSDLGHIWITLGSLDYSNILQPQENWFVNDKVAWVTIDHSLASYTEGPPD